MKRAIILAALAVAIALGAGTLVLVRGAPQAAIALQ
jgi:hypothetical protein